VRGAFLRPVGGVDHAGRVLRQGFGITHAHRTGDKLQRVHEADARGHAAAQLERRHAAKLAHLALGQFVLRKVWQARKVHAESPRD